jgi:hypothetical protein
MQHEQHQQKNTVSAAGHASKVTIPTSLREEYDRTKMLSSTNSNDRPKAETQECMVSATQLQIIQRRLKDGFGIGQGTWK